MDRTQSDEETFSALAIVSSSTETSGTADTWVIAPDQRADVMGGLRELWRYKHAARFFAFRSIQTLYVRTQLGRWWIILRPILPLVAGTLVFGGVMGMPSQGIPYFLFFLVGTIAWSAFERSFTWATRSLERNRQVVAKIYVPRVIIPPVAMAAGLVECLVLTGIYASAVAYYGLVQGAWYLPSLKGLPVALLAVSLAFGLAGTFGWFTSIWQAHGRDTRFVLGWVMGFWVYFTPVIYPLEHLSPRVQLLVLLNPMTAIVEAFRASVLGVGAVSWGGLAWSASVVAVAGVAGCRYFGRSVGRAVDGL